MARSIAKARTRVPLVALVTMVALVVLRGAARGDNVRQLVDELQNASSDKVRLAAALNLGRLGDASDQVVRALAAAVHGDDDRGVRAACAVDLGKLVGARTHLRRDALNALIIASSKDSSELVREQAKKAIKAISSNTGGGGGESNGGGGQAGGGGGIYVNVGPMSSKTGSNDAKFRALMVKTAQQTMQRNAGHMMTSWPGGVPSKAALAQRRVSGFYVDGTLNELRVRETGGGSTISCKVSMLLADYPDKSVFGFLNGGASVTASTSASDQELAGEDCVQAVIENLIGNKIIPTICSKVGGTCP